MDEFKLPPTRQAKMQALNPLMGLTILIFEIADTPWNRCDC